MLKLNTFPCNNKGKVKTYVSAKIAYININAYYGISEMLTYSMCSIKISTYRKVH